MLKLMVVSADGKGKTLVFQDTETKAEMHLWHLIETTIGQKTFSADQMIADIEYQLSTTPANITPMPQPENIPEKADGLNSILNAVADAIKERGLKIG